MRNPYFRPKNTEIPGYGEYYGYPKCCIDEFLTTPYYMRNRAYKTRHTHSVFNRSGFLPCRKCMKISHLRLVKIINRKRSKLLNSFLPGLQVK